MRHMVKITGLVIGPAAPINTDWEWNPVDPAAVSLTLHATEESVIWTFARALLHQMLEDGAAGDGDVVLAGGTAGVTLLLRSPEGLALIQYPRADVAAFADSLPRDAGDGEDGADGDGGYDVQSWIDRMLEEAA